jgi:hypothetical protein
VLLARARAVREGRQVLFGAEREVGWPPRWDWCWDGTDRARELRHDLRSRWEIQRLQGILPLAWGAGLGPAGDRERFAGDYTAALLDFLRVHPGPDGHAWESALELGLRLIALCQGLPLVVSTGAFRSDDLAVLHLLDRHARWLAADLSLDKVVRGNHLLGELAGLLAAGLLLPSARDAWWEGRDVQALLEEELLRQFHPDGVNVEQSLSYEKFILEFLLVAGLLARLRGRPFSPLVCDRLRRAARHLQAVTAPDGTLPPVGDNDSGRGALLSHALDPLHTGDLPDRLQAAFGTDPAGSPPPETNSEGGVSLRVFPQGGHVVVSSPGGDYLFLRGGPFGWGIPGPAAHSHADCLAPVLYRGGEPVLIDAGVYAYHPEDPALRDDLRTWGAHNAIRFEPSRGPVPRDRFRWGEMDLAAGIDGRLETGEVRIQGWVQWGRGAKALLWHRSVLYNEIDESWSFLDRVAGTDPVVWTFHFAPGVRAEPEPGGAVVRLTLPSGAVLWLDAEPQGEERWEEGHVAPAYGDLRKGPVLRRRFPSPPPEGARFHITPRGGAGRSP